MKGFRIWLLSRGSIRKEAGRNQLLEVLSGLFVGLGLVGSPLLQRLDVLGVGLLPGECLLKDVVHQIWWGTHPPSRVHARVHLRLLCEGVLHLFLLLRRYVLHRGGKGVVATASLSPLLHELL